MIKKSISILTISLLTFIFVSTGCKYNKLKKSKDVNAKFKAAEEYYDKEKYAKASTLYEDIMLLKRGTKEGQTILFKYAYCQFYMKDYILAGYYFRKYVKTYRKGKDAEEAQYLSAHCYFLDAPKSKLDQNATLTALQEYELFITSYPESPKIAECNDAVDKLREKLERKSFDNAKLYFNIGYYKAAAIALKNSMQDYPDTKYREDILFYIMKSHYLFAMGSIESKQKERFDEVLKAHEKLISKFPETQYLREANNILTTSNRKLKKLSI